MNAIFSKYDSDHNGYLDEKEVKSLLADTFYDQGPEGKKSIDQFYKKVDSNQDGKISKQ